MFLVKARPDQRVEQGSQAAAVWVVQMRRRWRRDPPLLQHTVVPPEQADIRVLMENHSFKTFQTEM